MTSLPPGMSIRTATGIDALDVRTLYKLLQLREQVFVVEQQCAYLEIDGRDLEPETTHLWVETEKGEIAAMVRLLAGRSPGSRPGTATTWVIGRVLTAPAWRGTGIASKLMQAALDVCDGHPIELDAQSYLTEWYERFGFTLNGPEFIEDGIPHTPMRREA